MDTNYEYSASRLSLHAAQLAEFYMWMGRRSSLLIDCGRHVGPRVNRAPVSYTMSELAKYSKVLKESNLSELFAQKLDRMANSLIPRSDNGDDMTEQGQQTLGVIKHYHAQKERLLNERAVFVRLLENRFGIYERGDRAREASKQLILLCQAAYVPYPYEDQKGMMYERFDKTKASYNGCSKAWYFPRTGVLAFEN